MNPKIPVAVLAAVLAAVGLLAPASSPNPTEAARFNNLGCAYMNQQLFEKGLKEFQQALEADPKLAIARLNEGIAYLNLQKIDEAKAAMRSLPSTTSSALPKSTPTTPTRGTSSAPRICRTRNSRPRSKRFSTRCRSAPCTPQPSSDCRAPISNPPTPTTPASTSRNSSTSRKTNSARP